MARAINAIDVDGSPNLDLLVEEFVATGEPIVRRRDGRAVAVMISAKGVEGGTSHPTLSEAERRAFLETAGGWRGLIDAEAFLANIAESRSIASRPPVELE